MTDKTDETGFKGPKCVGSKAQSHFRDLTDDRWNNGLTKQEQSDDNSGLWRQVCIVGVAYSRQGSNCEKIPGKKILVPLESPGSVV